jgi:hypothetical protein
MCFFGQVILNIFILLAELSVSQTHSCTFLVFCTRTPCKLRDLFSISLTGRKPLKYSVSCRLSPGPRSDTLNPPAGRWILRVIFRRCLNTGTNSWIALLAPTSERTDKVKSLILTALRSAVDNFVQGWISFLILSSELA